MSAPVLHPNNIHDYMCSFHPFAHFMSRRHYPPPLHIIAFFHLPPPSSTFSYTLPSLETRSAFETRHQVLVTGDKDFMPAMARTRQKGRRICLCSMRNSCNQDLLKDDARVMDFEPVWINEYIDDLMEYDPTS